MFYSAISVPEDARAGYTGMRIRLDWDDPDSDPCGSTSYGEVEDYRLLVMMDDMGACCFGDIAEPPYAPWQCIGDMSAVDCSALGEYTNWTAGASCADPLFFCPGTPTYCDALGNCGEFIAHVQINEIDNLTSCSLYADYTTMFTTLVFGQTYSITVTNGRPYSSDVCSIWINWNQDKTFEDTAPELIGDVRGGGPYSLNIQVPAAGGSPGYTRMRIRIDYASPHIRGWQHRGCLARGSSRVLQCRQYGR